MKKILLVLALAGCSFLAAAQQEPWQKDWARFSRYASQNEEVKDRPLVVLMGDSITDGWAKQDGDWLKDNRFVGRGISGQTTSEMLVRFRPDVIELNPEYVAILAGIYDIACNNGYIKLENVMGNIKSMVELAETNGIRPILSTLLPAGEIGWRRQLGDPRPRIDSLNTMIRGYAETRGIPLIDYHTAMKDRENAMQETFRRDAVHPNIEGYKVMEKELLSVLDKLVAGEGAASRNGCCCCKRNK